MPSSGSIQQSWKLFTPFILILIPPSVFCGFACLSNPCIHGVCLDDLNTTYSCYCIDGYTGIQCQTNWDECWSNPCQNGGICNDGIASYNCSCPAGFVGDMCEEDVNECESNPCHNNGTCRDVANGYICNCVPGYSGVHCEIDVAVCDSTNETRCANGGECVDGPGVIYSCKCQPGWTGFLCDVEIDECMSAPCQNGAICIDMHADYSCACLFGFTGQNCEEMIMVCEDSPCRNSALCLMEAEHPVCYCVPDFHGDKCQYQYDECQLGPRCMNGGTCIDGVDNFTCSCPPSLTGVLCECLILGDNKYDCTYVNPPATVTFSPTRIPNSTYSIEQTKFTTQIPEQTSTTKMTTDVISTEKSIDQTTTEQITTVRDITEDTTRTTITEKTTTELVSEETTSEKSSTEITFPTNLYSTSITTFSTDVPNISTLLPETSTLVSTTFSNITLQTLSTDLTTTKTTPEISTILTTMGLTTLSTEETSIYFETTKPSRITTPTTEVNVYSTTDLGLTETISTTVQMPEITKSTPYLSTTSEKSLPSTLETTTYDINTTITTSARGLTDTTTTEGETTIFSTTTVPTTISQLTSTESRSSETELETTSQLTTIIEGSTPNMSLVTDFTYSTVFPSVSTLLTEHFTTIRTQTPETTFPTSATIFTTEGYTTPMIYPDCSKEGNHCENGGSCIFTSEGHRCVCPFDTEGYSCENHLGIRNAAFGGDSFLSHRLTDKSMISIEFKAKTLSSSGIIFYSNIDTTYMSLYVENGYLKFKFSCGFQTMLLSELKVPVNNGYLMNIKAELKFGNDLKHCYATINLNNSLSMSGDQIALVNKFSKINSWLHLGGIAQENVKDFLPVSGFVGCMMDLKISGRKINIFKDAEDGFEVSECSSLACLSNPCANGATCTGIGDSWSCYCKNGFSGRMCEVSVCENNPCQYGGTCVPFTGSGYICLCPYGKHGHFCENDMEISETHFSSSIHGLSSFAAYPIPDGIANKMELKFRFLPTTFDQIAVLLFVGQKGQHDPHSDHLAVSFVKGYIMLTWNLGSGPRRIFTTKPIENNGSNHLVRVGRSGRRAWLFVENLGNVTGRSPGNLVHLDVVPILYLGGHESLNFSSLPHDLPLHSGFAGCIYDVEIKSGSVIIPLQGSRHTIGRALGQCGTTECYDKICRNGGACLYHGGTFTCLCQDGWYGPLCSSRYNPCDSFKHNCTSGSTCVPLISDYECDCPIGKTGRYCEKEEKLSDISLTGIRSYIKLDPIDFDPSKFSIDLEMRPLGEKGLLLFIGRQESFLSLSIQSSMLEIRIIPGRRKHSTNDLISIRSNKILAKGTWHKIRIGKYGRKVYLFVDNVVNTGILQTLDTLFIGGENIYLGGLQDMSFLPSDAMSTLPTPYKGCVRQFTINFKHIPLNISNIKHSRNVGNCDGTPCGGEYCENGGTCWVDPHLKPHCTCVDPYTGDRCDQVPSCENESCRNKGKCIGNKCSCIVGFSGAFCENSITVKIPKFQGTSYLIVDRHSDKKRGTDVDGLKSLQLNFTTANQDGLLLWSSKGKNFIGVGLENGYLKFVYSWGKSNKHIELPDVGQISDGLWHTLEIELHPIVFKIDNEILYTQKTYEKIEDDVGNGTFYLGGLPKTSPIFNEITAIYPKGFEGCIESFGSNKNSVIKDFTNYEGENIGTCNLI